MSDLIDFFLLIPHPFQSHQQRIFQFYPATWQKQLNSAKSSHSCARDFYPRCNPGKPDSLVHVEYQTDVSISGDNRVRTPGKIGPYTYEHCQQTAAVAGDGTRRVCDTWIHSHLDTVSHTSDSTIAASGDLLIWSCWRWISEFLAHVYPFFSLVGVIICSQILKNYGPSLEFEIREILSNVENGFHIMWMWSLSFRQTMNAKFHLLHPKIWLFPNLTNCWQLFRRLEQTQNTKFLFWNTSSKFFIK